MKVKKFLWILLTILITSSLVLGACVPAEPEATEEAVAEEEEMVEEEEEEMAEEEADLGTVTIGTNAEYPPFEYVDDEGNITGFDVDLMTAIAEAAGFEFEFVNTRWDGIFVALASGEFDAVISAATITEERAEMVNFSDPYFNAGQRLAVLADETEITGPDDLAGKKVGVQLGTTGDIWLTDNTEAEVVRYDENTLAFQALANGDVDAAMADGPTAVDIIKANPEMDLKVLDGVYTDEEYGIAVNKDREDVLAAINEGLAAVKESGAYDEIYDKYFGTEVAEEEPAAELGAITIGTNAEYPPFEYVDEEGNITGFDVDLMNAIAEEAGFEFEFVNTRWDGIFVALASGEFDAVISAATITEERAEMVNFSDPYFNAGQRLAVRADETEITGPDDLAGKKVGVQLGTTGDIWLTDNTEAEVVRYDENTLAFQALANGDVDAAMADGPTAVDIIKANPEMGLKVLDGVYTDEEYGIAVNKDREDLLAAINDGLAAVKESGTYDDIYDKYFGTEGAADGEELVVGLMTDKSGALAIYGPSQTNGFYLGLEYATDGSMEVAGRPIRVIEKDNGSDPETGVSQARELIEAEGADVLIGNIHSSVALAVMPVVEENDVIYIAEPAASPQITGANFSPNTFRTSRTSYQDALVMGKGLLEMGDTFVQIAPDNAFGIGSACSFYPVVKEGGGEFTINDTAEDCGTVFAPLETTDFTPYINQILDSDADVVIVTWAGAGFAPLFQQMTQLGVFDEMVIGTGVGDNQSIAAGYADAVGSTGVQVYHYTLPDNEINDWLVDAHIEEYGTPPDLWAAGGMMAAIMMVEGLEATAGDSSADALIEVYEDDFQFEGPKGTVMIRPYDHVALQNLYFVRVDNVDDPDLKFVELVKDYAPEETAPPCQLPEEYADRCP